jgi:hypothetical protein
MAERRLEVYRGRVLCHGPTVARLGPSLCLYGTFTGMLFSSMLAAYITQDVAAAPTNLPYERPLFSPSWRLGSFECLRVGAIE